MRRAVLSKKTESKSWQELSRVGRCHVSRRRPRPFARERQLHIHAMPFDADALVEQYKIKCNDEIKSNRQRNRLKNDLTERAQVHHRTGNYEGSYDLFCHLLAAIETDPYTTQVSEMRATITANIASALQFLGEEEGAKVRVHCLCLRAAVHAGRPVCVRACLLRRADRV